jgi:CHASE2 domain-containing sensor protein
MTGFMIERNLVMLACAVSAGIHAALTREHFAEGLGPGGGFLAATLLLGVLGLGLAHRPDGCALLVAAALVLIGLIGSYALATTTGIPILHAEVEPVESLAVLTKAVEIGGLLAAAHLLWRSRDAAFAPAPSTKESVT